MYKRIFIGTAILAGAGLAVHHYSPTVEFQNANHVDHLGGKSLKQEHDPQETHLSLSKVKDDLLSNEKTLAYLKKEEEKKRLQDYFENPTGENPQAIFELIEKIEQEGRVVAFEALSLKLAWLELNTTDAQDFQTKSEQVIEEYRKKAADSQAAHQPSSIPGFDEYKEREQAIIHEINSMHEFPDGHTRQSYLRSRLQQAREMAYQ